VFQVTSGIELPRGNYWPALVTVSLVQGNKRVDSIRVLLDKNYLDSAVILTRSLFEIAVNLNYIAKDVPKRLPEYLKHGKVPITDEEVEKLKKELEKVSQEEVRNIIPRRAWRRLKKMCCDLGLDWLKTYEIFYRYVSVPTHAGAFTLGKDYMRLLEQQSPSDCEKTVVLVTALDFHLRIAEVAAGVFPVQIKLETVKKMRSECQKLGKSLV
jgi:hypothetical protein